MTSRWAGNDHRQCCFNSAKVSDGIPCLLWCIREESIWDIGNTYKHSKYTHTFMYSWLNHFAFQESVRKAADLTLKTLSKVKLFATALACVYYEYVYVRLPIRVCPGVHPYVWVHRLCSPENCGSDVAHPVGERHREQCARGPLIKVMTSKSKANHIWPSCWTFLFSHYKILTDTSDFR